MSLRLRSTALTGLAALVLAPAAGAWSWPVSGSVLRPFTLGDDPYLGGQHRGIDVAGAAGEAVVAPHGGVVAFAAQIPTSGLTVTIRTDDGYSVTLTHLGAIAVRRNATVTEGERVGTLGASGTGDSEWPRPYVHLGVRTDSDPNGYLDPLGFLPPRTPRTTSTAP